MLTLILVSAVLTDTEDESSGSGFGRGGPRCMHTLPGMQVGSFGDILERK